MPITINVVSSNPTHIEVNGYDLLRMKAKDINSLIEHDEAQRLTGHLTLQKNMSGVSYTIFHFFCNFCIFVFNITLEWC
jgi:hypothetical protein